MKQGVPRQSRIALVALFASSHLKGEARKTKTRDGKAERKTVLVIGSTDGIGRLALKLGPAGARVLVHGRNAERGARVVADIEESLRILPPVTQTVELYCGAVLARRRTSADFCHYLTRVLLGNGGMQSMFDAPMQQREIGNWPIAN